MNIIDGDDCVCGRQMLMTFACKAYKRIWATTNTLTSPHTRQHKSQLERKISWLFSF